MPAIPSQLYTISVKLQCSQTVIIYFVCPQYKALTVNVTKLFFNLYKNYFQINKGNTIKKAIKLMGEFIQVLLNPLIDFI